MVHSLFIYPIKSLQGIAVEQIQLTDRGPRGDRRYMLIDEQGNFMTQRAWPQMALFRTQQNEAGFRVSHPTAGEVALPFQWPEGEPLQTHVWEDAVRVRTTSSALDTFFSDALNTKCRLVHFADEERRNTDARYAAGKLTSLADGYPYLLIGTASLNELNQRLESPVTIERFRPNMVVETQRAFEEDQWRSFQLGTLSFENVKPCSRCVMVNVDPHTGERYKEPLRTLATFRTVQNKVMFGVNVVSSANEGTVRIGDPLLVLSKA